MQGFRAIKLLLREFTPYRWAIFWIVLLGFLISIIQPLCVKLSESVVDQLQAGVGEDFFRTVPLMLIGLFIVSGLAKFFYTTIRRYVTEKVIVKLRADLFKKYLFSPMSQIQQRKTGEMLSSIQNDLVQVHVGVDTIYDLLKEPVTFFGLLGVAFYCDWKLALCTLLVAPIAAHFFSKSGAAVKKYSANNMAHFSDIVSLSQEAIVGSHVVKVFSLQNVLLSKFKQIQDSYFQTLWRSIRVQELATPVVEFIGAMLMAGVLVYGGYRISQGTLTSGQLIAFVIAIGLAQMPLKSLNNAYLKLKNAEAAAERIFGVLLSSKPSESKQSGQSKATFEGSIVFQQVSLAYGDKRALSDINFQVRKGERVAFVGHSGSGKSSIVNLLPRLHDVTGGKILIDGVDIRSVQLEDLRSLISFVTQDTFLFHDTIYENIRYGKPDASRAEVKAAATMAYCDQFLSRFPAGFETRVGDRGATLSGGERQRVAIARAILKQAPILILDEATSNLDSESESIVRQALERLMEGKTTFMVAHRLSTITKANRIFVVDGGEIREQGEHQDLIHQKGIYSRFVEQQSFV